MQLPGNTTNVQKETPLKNFEEANIQYAPMISALIRKLHIYRDFESFHQVGRIALWQACNRFDETKGDFTPFAYRSIQGALLDELKRESRYATRFAVTEMAEFDSIAEELEDDCLPEWLGKIKLDKNERALLEELFVKGKNVATLAEMEQLSLSGMKKRRERLLKKVKEGFAGMDRFGDE